MAGTTLNRGYPYPTGTDANDVPFRMQALAEAVDADIENIANGHGVIQAVTAPGSQNDYSTTQVVAQLTRTYEAGRKYRINAYIEGTQITNAGTVTARLAGSADVPKSILIADSRAANQLTAGSVVALFEPSTTGSRTLQVTVQSTAAAFRVAANAASLWVEDVTNG